MRDLNIFIILLNAAYLIWLTAFVAKDILWLRILTMTGNLIVIPYYLYHFEDPLPSELDLHAWAELYIPGAGWRGFDPSGKGLIDDRYLTLVSSSKSNLTSVITGNFIGKNNLENTLSWEIKPLEIK